MKHQQSHIRSISHDTNSKLDGQGKFNLDYALPDSAEIINMNTASRQTPQFDAKSDVSPMSSSQDIDKPSRKSARISLMGLDFLV